MESPLAVALALWRKGDRLAALGAARKAAESAPSDARTHVVFGAIQRQIGYVDGAILALERAHELDPDDAETLRMLSDVYRRAWRPREALRAAERAFERDPSTASAIALGHALLANEELAAAEAMFARVLAADERDVRAWMGRAQLASVRADWSAASAAFERARELAPGDPDVRYGLARMHLRFGRYAEGFADYPAIMDTDSDGARYYYHREGVARWNGEPLQGRRLVISADLGLGDHLQMARFFDALPHSTPAISVETPAPLLTLFERNFTNVRFTPFTHWSSPANWDVHLPVTQLPCISGIRTASDIHGSAYLHADPERVKVWRRSLADGGNVRNVGIVWHGNRENTRDRWRAAPLQYWEPLAQVAGVRFHSLQVGADDAETSAAPFPLAATHVSLRDLDDTAALMTALDAVISVDTSTLHLAGALGRPAWLPNPLVSDYRWGIDAVATPWYDSVRIIRQAARDDWTPVFRTIAAELAEFTSRARPDR
jgi:tetratricopeptide (TPR) repeat protein